MQFVLEQVSLAMLKAIEFAVLNAMLEAVCARTSFTCNA